MVSDIRQDKTADIQELSDYKVILEKYMALLPKNFKEKPLYLKTIQNVSCRIQLLTTIDHELSIDYDYCTLRNFDSTIQYLKQLQNDLNKPSSARHAQLDEKIKHIELLQEENKYINLYFSQDIKK